MQEKVEAKLRDIARRRQTRIARRDLRGSAIFSCISVVLKNMSLLCWSRALQTSQFQERQKRADEMMPRAVEAMQKVYDKTQEVYGEHKLLELP